MGLVSPDQVQASDSVVPEPINTPINQLAAVINGNLDNDNIASGAGIDPTKIAGGTTGMFSAWTSYTPSVSGTGSALGNGTITGHYIRVGKTVIAKIEFILGSTSTVGSNLSFSLPVTASTNSATIAKTPIGRVVCNDASANQWAALARLETTTTMRVLLENVAGTFPQMVATSATGPFTWTTSDSANALVTFEAA